MRIFVFVFVSVVSAGVHADPTLQALIERQEAVLAFRPGMTIEQLHRQRAQMDGQERDARLTLHGDLVRIRRDLNAHGCGVSGSNPITVSCPAGDDDDAAGISAVMAGLAFSDLRVLRLRRVAAERRFEFKVEQVALPLAPLKMKARPSPPPPTRAEIDAFADAGADVTLIAAARARQDRVESRAAVLSLYDENQRRLPQVLGVVSGSIEMFQHELSLAGIVFDVLVDDDVFAANDFDVVLAAAGKVVRIACTPMPGAERAIVQRAREQQNAVVELAHDGARLHLTLTLR